MDDTEVHRLNNSLLSELTKSCHEQMNCPVFKRCFRSLVYRVERVIGVHLVYLHFRQTDNFKVVAGICSGNAVIVFSDKSADALLLTANGYLSSRC